MGIFLKRLSCSDFGPGILRYFSRLGSNNLKHSQMWRGTKRPAKLDRALSTEAAAGQQVLLRASGSGPRGRFPDDCI